MEIDPQKKDFLTLFKEASAQGNFIKLTLSKVFKTSEGLKNVYVVPVVIKGKNSLSFTYRFQTKDQVKNYPLEQAVVEIDNLLEVSFLPQIASQLFLYFSWFSGLYQLPVAPNVFPLRLPLIIRGLESLPKTAMYSPFKKD